MPPQDRHLLKGPLRPPQPKRVASTYTQPVALKNEIFVGNQNKPQFKEISLTSLPQPFLNPGDAFSHLSLGSS
ncbi:hypothetical protein B0T25DRAFT_341859 [Lasiosphaeria hispida]|uniref:Uncharacterized protein n=1 Tax=Lasiosphaeria hispida TaxID=260671 RepID=A0AAJ0H6F8_9PEZI|nr:hypothetical protein B0T25DRAFT_341859 [Lasiosphaeria hispida]